MRDDHIVIGIDPGYDRLGLAVLTQERGTKPTLLYSACATSEKDDAFPTRLHVVTKAVASAIMTYKPNVLAMENLFLSNNQKTAMHVAEVRGALIYLAAESGLLVAEYTPLQVKLAVTGNGKSDKRAVFEMLGHLVDLPPDSRLDDEYDAIGVGITHLASAQNRYPHT